MSAENVDTGNPEADKRMDEILNPDDSSSGLASAVPADDSRVASPLTTLKSIVLSMDWEISDRHFDRVYSGIAPAENRSQG